MRGANTLLYIFEHNDLFFSILDVAHIKRKIGYHKGEHGCAENESDTAAREVNNVGLKIRRFPQYVKFPSSKRAGAFTASPSEKLLEDAGQFFSYSRRAA